MTADKSPAPRTPSREPQLAKPQAWRAWAQEAADAGHWREALSRADSSLARFGPDAERLRQRAEALLNLGRLQEAQIAFQSLAGDHPDRPAGTIGLARVAMRRGDWDEAAALWTAAIRVYPDKATPGWSRMLATVLGQLGRHVEAEQHLVRLTRDCPDEAEFKLARVRAALDVWATTDAAPERVRALRDYVRRELCERSDTPSRLAGVRALTELGDNEAAADELRACAGRLETLEDAESFFRCIPMHVERGSRGPLWAELLAFVRASSDLHADRRPHLAAELELRLLLALERFAEFRTVFETKADRLRDDQTRLLIERVCDRLGMPKADVYSEAKIFGIGLGRTGTTTLTEALGVLGFDCAHWQNPLTFQIIDSIDIYMFGASADAPVAQRFEQLYYLYPNARFIWTPRPVEAWVASLRHRQLRSTGARNLEELADVLGREQAPYMAARAEADWACYMHPDGLEAAYHRFEQRVRRFFSDKPTGKLMEFRITEGEGWPQLCAFLGREPPDLPFPRENARQ